MRNLVTLILLVSMQIVAYSQNENDSTIIVNTVSALPATDSSPVKRRTYKPRPAVDIPLTAIGTGWSLYAFSKIYSKDQTPEEVILNLNKRNIPSFDRHGADVYHPKADELGDMLFYGSMPLPYY